LLLFANKIVHFFNIQFVSFILGCPEIFLKFHQLSNRRKRRRVAENEDCSYVSDHYSSPNNNDSSNEVSFYNDNSNKQINASN